MQPYHSPLDRAGDEVLDLCCVTSPMIFWFKEQGAKVIGIDFAPYTLALATEEASHRNSSVKFIETDIFIYDLRQEHYNLISCFGNSISDFALFVYANIIKIVTKALKSGERFMIQYHDAGYSSLPVNLFISKQ